MTFGTRTHETATLIVAECQAVPEHMRDGVRELISVRTHYADQRKGYATALMKAVCEEADAARKVLLLTVAALGEMDEPTLIGWYHRFGFQVLPKALDAVTIVMARQPRIARPVAIPTVIANTTLPPDLEMAQAVIGELRKRGIPLREAMRLALQDTGRSH